MPFHGGDGSDDVDEAVVAWRAELLAARARSRSASGSTPSPNDAHSGDTSSRELLDLRAARVGLKELGLTQPVGRTPMRGRVRPGLAFSAAMIAGLRPFFVVVEIHES